MPDKWQMETRSKGQNYIDTTGGHKLSLQVLRKTCLHDVFNKIKMMIYPWLQRWYVLFLTFAFGSFNFRNWESEFEPFIPEMKN